MTARRRFGILSDGHEVSVITLVAGQLTARILTLGAILQDLRLAGTPWPLVLGADFLAAYEGPMGWFGAVVGPVANRIGGATALIDGQTARFEANEGPNTLHSGSSGTAAHLWQITTLAPDRVTLQLDLPAGFGGFPGNRVIRAAYQVLPPATLALTLSAQTDAPTLMNLAHHPYWNLDGTADARDHRLQVAADAYLPTDTANLPLAPRPLNGDPRDLRAARGLAGLPPLDHNYCLGPAPGPLRATATLTGAKGVCLTLATTAPGLQVYDGAGIDCAPYPGLTGVPYGPHAGVALEPQLWPDATNHADFPPIVLRPGSVWRQQTHYRLYRADLAGDRGAHR